MLQTRFKQCGASDLPEYWHVSWDENGTYIDHVQRKAGWTRPEVGKRRSFFYCQPEFSGPAYVDLCRSCMVRYGLLW
jgi:hypothetical protein